MEENRNQAIGIGPWLQIVAFLFAVLIIICRRPDAIFHPQPYAEDGHVWFADAYNLGWWPALFRTWTGYFITLPRLAAALALLVPFSRFPLVMNLVALPFQALPVNILLSSRSSAWGSLKFRATLALMYLILPNCSEISNGVTDANFLTGICAFLLLVAGVPEGKIGRLFELSLFFICGLSGPFCIFLLPLSVFLAYKRKESWRWVRVGAILASCLVQMSALLFLAPGARANRVLGASPILFARILSGQIYLGTLLGHNSLALHSGRNASIVLVVIAMAGTALVAWCFAKSPLPMKLFLLFAAMLFVSSLIAPVEWGRPSTPIWVVLAGSQEHRYWLFPTLAFAWTLLWCVQDRSLPLRSLSASLLLIMCIGVIRDWRHHNFPDVRFAESVTRFAAAPPGCTVVLPISPQGWDMRLVKHPGAR